MNLNDVKKGIVLHQVNLQGAMGAGIALAIRKRWPVVYEAYRAYYKHAKLGSIQTVKIEDTLFVINLFAQKNFGRTERHTNYSAFEICLRKAGTFCTTYPELGIYIPYKIGCGNGGGDWEIISRFIVKEFGKLREEESIGQVYFLFKR